MKWLKKCKNFCEGAACLFVGFLNMWITSKWITKIALTLAPLTFGIYLIHDHSQVRDFLWNEVLKLYQYADKPYMILVVLIFSVAVFVVCAGVKKIRMWIWKVSKVDFMDDKLSRIVDKLNALLVDCLEKENNNLKGKS